MIFPFKHVVIFLVNVFCANGQPQNRFVKLANSVHMDTAKD